MDEIYTERADSTVYVLRLSRTAQGVRTYTVGASVPEAADGPAAVARLFELERAVIAEIDGNGGASARRSGNSLVAQMRRTMLLNRLRAAGGWQTTPELLAGNDAVRSRSQMVADLSALVRDGLVEYEAGGKGHGQRSRYRLVK